MPPDVDVFTENEEVEEPVEDEEEEDEDEDEAAGGGGIGTLGWVAIGIGERRCSSCSRLRHDHRVEAPAHPTPARGSRPGDAHRRCMARTHRPLRGGRACPRPTGRRRSKRSVRWPSVDAAAAATEDQLVGLAREVDRAAYDRTSPPPEAADTAWRYSDEAVDALLANQSLPRRTRMRVDPRTLMTPRPARPASATIDHEPLHTTNRKSDDHDDGS